MNEAKSSAQKLAMQNKSQNAAALVSADKEVAALKVKLRNAEEAGAKHANRIEDLTSRAQKAEKALKMELATRGSDETAKSSEEFKTRCEALEKTLSQKIKTIDSLKVLNAKLTTMLKNKGAASGSSSAIPGPAPATLAMSSSSSSTKDEQAKKILMAKDKAAQLKAKKEAMQARIAALKAKKAKK